MLDSCEVAPVWSVHGVVGANCHDSTWASNGRTASLTSTSQSGRTPRGAIPRSSIDGAPEAHNCAGTSRFTTSWALRWRLSPLFLVSMVQLRTSHAATVDGGRAESPSTGTLPANHVVRGSGGPLCRREPRGVLV